MLQKSNTKSKFKSCLQKSASMQSRTCLPTVAPDMKHLGGFAGMMQIFTGEVYGMPEKSGLPSRSLRTPGTSCSPLWTRSEIAGPGVGPRKSLDWAVTQESECNSVCELVVFSSAMRLCPE